MAFAMDDPDLWRLWLKLPRHRNIIAARTRGWLRFAALDWRFQIPEENHDVHVATRGYELTWPCEFLLRVAPAGSLRELVAPILYVDVQREARLVFESPNMEPHPRLPPEAAAGNDCDERALVFVVGRLMLDLDARLSTASSPLGDVVRRCMEARSDRRYATLGELRDALRLAGSRRVPLPGLRSHLEGWTSIEDGIGFLQVGNPQQARARFRDATDDPSALSLALAMLEATPDVTADETCTWADAEPVVRERERLRDFTGAIAILERVRRDTADAVALELALARCYLASGSAGHAADHAQRVLAVSSSHAEALEIRCEALLRCGRPAEALDTAAAWVFTGPQDARAHYMRGKCLFRLARFIDARAAFERACVLDPRLVEALVLRREVDRMLGRVRDHVGTPAPMGLEIPEHLAELRVPIEDGRIRDAIAVLLRDEHASDAAAQLLLGELRAFEGQLDEAMAAFERAATLDPEHPHAAWLGKARVLLEASRAEEALALFDRVHVERPDLAEALAGRAKALQLLGREREAEDALGQYVRAEM